MNALEHSAFENEFIARQLIKLVAIYDQQLEAPAAAIAQLIDNDSVLKPRVEQPVSIGSGPPWITETQDSTESPVR